AFIIRRIVVLPKVFASEETWHVRFLLDMCKQRRRHSNGLLCACIIAACVLLTYPVAEMGFQDDWSYVRTALEFARTGHFVYDGCRRPLGYRAMPVSMSKGGGRR